MSTAYRGSVSAQCLCFNFFFPYKNTEGGRWAGRQTRTLGKRVGYGGGQVRGMHCVLVVVVVVVVLVVVVLVARRHPLIDTPPARMI